MLDANGCMVPLVPDFTNGMREPSYLGLPATSHFSVGIKYISPGEVTTNMVSSHSLTNRDFAKNNEIPKSANKMSLVACLLSPEPRTTEPKIESLIQNIQYCNHLKVKAILKDLEQADEEERRFQILNAHTNGNRNLFHTAVMQCFAGKNKEQADDFKQVIYENGKIVLIAPASSKNLDKTEMSEAEAVGKKFDQRWQEMIGHSSEAGSKPSSKEGSEERDKADAPQLSKLRQRHAIMILAELNSSTVMNPYVEELMKQKDIYGHTPFYSAINARAYTSALILWTKFRELKANNVEALTKYVTTTVHNDSSMFILCYNDTCSFTWTGEEHINQDIFECKTCDLVGSLCCCTECAYTCHRDHDCK